MSGASGVSCPTCGAPRAQGDNRCAQCKQVFGEVNRCRACGALAAANEVDGGRLLCAACGAPRERLPGTVVDSDLADLLTRRARSAGLLGSLFRVAAVGAALFGLSAGGLQAAFDLGSPALTMVVFVVGAVGLFVLGGRSHSRKGVLLDQALERRLLAEVGQHAGGATVERVAAELAQPTARVDASLTQLAKRGRLALDVDDAGTLRYRVATDEPLDVDLDPAARETDKRRA